MSDIESNDEELKKLLVFMRVKEIKRKSVMEMEKCSLKMENFILETLKMEKEGYGVYKFKNGAKYSGNYVNNLREGKGSFLYPDSSKYQVQKIL
ncbi:hypothetical protein H8356DRAFT_1331365 [Neocallimastix lanati (nom. inval.)]|nr:hypothetical protein H8356DRAFT_1331365 [Neocallimastix sp. JGI-2020a]